MNRCRSAAARLLFSILLLVFIGLQCSIVEADQPVDWSSAGPYAVSVTNQTWHDSSRSRDIPVRIYSPVGEQGTHAVVIFSHGLGGNVSAGEDWGRQWASWGLTTVHLQHPGSDTVAVRESSGTIMQRMRSAMTVEQLIARCRDVSFAITEIAARQKSKDVLFADVDPTLIGLSGHSFGAQTTLAVAGEKFGLGFPQLADKRIKAFIAFSPSSRASDTLDTAFGSITSPFLSLTGSQDQIEMTPQITPENRTLPFAHMAAGSKYLLWLNSATHMSFSGQHQPRLLSLVLTPAVPMGQTPPDKPHIDSVVKAVTTAFWFAYLAPNSDIGKKARAWLDGPAPAALLKPNDRWQHR
jgi:predicted dienelactone hydrolase